jgi:hypothetical protein
MVYWIAEYLVLRWFSLCLSHAYEVYSIHNQILGKVYPVVIFLAIAKQLLTHIIERLL